MRRMLNTIYITKEGTHIMKEGETILCKLDGEKVLQLPIYNIEGVVIFTKATITPQVMEMCSNNNIHISFISHTGKFLVRLQNPINGNVRLRKSQYSLADNSEQSLRVAKNFCIGKIFNCRSVLLRYTRDHGDLNDTSQINIASNSMYTILKIINDVQCSQELLGKEGDAAKVYYSVFDELITRKESGLKFNGRSKRPPLDEVNALLSFFYTLLAHEVEAALETVGLDPQVGFYHKIRPGRSSLALDLMEELRPYLVDRFILTLINNNQITKGDFVKKENGAVLISPESKSSLIQAWQKRKSDTIIHPYLKEKIEVGLLPYAQALVLARFIRKDIEDYPPFLMR